MVVGSSSVAIVRQRIARVRAEGDGEDVEHQQGADNAKQGQPDRSWVSGLLRSPEWTGTATSLSPKQDSTCQHLANLAPEDR